MSNRFEVFLKFCKWCRGIEFALLNPKEQSLPAPNSLCFYVWHGPQFRQNEMGSCRVRRCHVTIREEVWKYGENYPKYFLSKEATKTSLLDWTTCPQFFLLSNKLWDYNKLVTEFDWNWIPWGIFQLYFRFNEQPLRHFLTSALQFWYGLINVADSKYDFFVKDMYHIYQFWQQFLIITINASLDVSERFTVQNKIHYDISMCICF